MTRLLRSTRHLSSERSVAAIHPQRSLSAVMQSAPTLDRPRSTGWRSIVRFVAPMMAAVAGVAVALGGRPLRLLLGGFGALCIPLILTLSNRHLVEMALVALFFSRIGVAYGAPSALNFIHFPLVLLAAATATRAPDRSPNRVASALGMGAGGLLAVALLSALANGTSVVAAILDWLVLCEPFLLIYAVVRDPPPDSSRSRLEHLLLAVVIMQVPFALWQTLTRGVGDAVQGTFIGQGAGAHVVGAASIVAALFVASTNVVRPRHVRIAAALSLATLPLLADAKQVLLLFVVAYAATSLAHSPKYWFASAFGVAALAGVVVVAVRFVPGWQLVTNRWVFVDGLTHKLQVFTLIRSHFDTWSDWLLGIGPGNTVSRVAVMALPDYGGRSSLLPRLGVDPSPVATQLFAIDTESYLARSGVGSSAWSFVFSWAGLFGDLGVLGVAMYAWLGIIVWRATTHLSHDRRANAAHVTLALLVLLATVYGYLEEPAVTLSAAGWIAFVVVAGQACRVSADRAAPLDRRR